MEQLLAVTLSYKQPHFSINSENEKSKPKLLLQRLFTRAHNNRPRENDPKIEREWV